MLLQSPLQNFAQMIAIYFAEIWDFLIFIGRVSGIIIVLVGAILWFTDTNQGREKAWFSVVLCYPLLSSTL